MANRRSFFERLTGGVRIDDNFEEESPRDFQRPAIRTNPNQNATEWEQEELEGELTVDMYQTPDSIVVKTMAAGVKPDDLDISISRDAITIRGKRESSREVNEQDYYCKELYWGAFSRTLALPDEIDVEQAQAVEKHGLVIITLPKINKDRQAKLKVKSN